MLNFKENGGWYCEVFAYVLSSSFQKQVGRQEVIWGFSVQFITIIQCYLIYLQDHPRGKMSEQGSICVVVRNEK